MSVHTLWQVFLFCHVRGSGELQVLDHVFDTPGHRSIPIAALTNSISETFPHPTHPLKPDSPRAELLIEKPLLMRMRVICRVVRDVLRHYVIQDPTEDQEFTLPLTQKQNAATAQSNEYRSLSTEDMLLEERANNPE